MKDFWIDFLAASGLGFLGYLLTMFVMSQGGPH